MNSPRKPETPILAGLICFGVAAIVLGVMHLGRVIKPPRATAGTYQSPEELEAQQRIALATLDTDKDTIPDLDELERTFTSPYLADSDSDGIDDAKELSAGTDPNCPTGQECAGVFRSESGPDRGSGFSPSDSEIGNRQSAIGNSVGGVGSVIENQKSSIENSFGLPTSGDFDPLRLLTGALGTQSQIANRKSQIPSEGFGNEIENQKSPIENSLDLSSLLKNLPQTPAAIRAALKQNGIPDSQLQQIDDAALMDLWNQSLQGLETTTQPRQ